MSRKHNTKHEERGTSNYPTRPGMYRLRRNAQMDTAEHLRGVQDRRIRETCTLDPGKHSVHQCNGSPLPNGLSEDLMFEAA
jgi:hypothetical protein